MKSRWLNTFTIIGVVLVILGVYGVLQGPGFVYDPGQISNGKEPWYYLIIGLLMIFNGLLTPAPTPESEETAVSSTSKTRAPGAETAKPAGPGPSTPRNTEPQNAVGAVSNASPRE